ncbi:hypothetical protein GGF46_004853 [Coemansia sp. RSA 552]|nr:hypothetical protein GGF46_004853 [Coemansia sp. RSA 552]
MPARGLHSARPNLSLRQFIQRGKVIAMYRQFMRLTKRIDDNEARRETRQWIRGDFERYRNESDLQRVEVLLAQARRQYKEMEGGVFSLL